MPASQAAEFTSRLLKKAYAFHRHLTEPLRVSADLLGQIVFINADNKSKDGPPAVGLYEVVGFSNHACGVNARTGEHTLLLRQPDHGGEPVYLTGYGMYGKFNGYWEHVEPCDISPRLPCCFCGAPRLPLPGWTPSPFTAAFAAMTGSEKWAFMEACNAVGFSPCDVCTEEESLIELHTRNVLWRDRRAGLCTADGSWAGGGADGAAGGTAEGAAGGSAAGGGAAGVVAGGGAADGAAGGAACGAAGGGAAGRGLATTLLERPEGGGIERLLDALRGVPSPPLAGMCGGGVPHRSRGGGAEVSEITGVCSNATSFPSSILPPERPHCGGSEHLLAALRGVPAMCQRGLCAAGVPEKTSSSLPDTRAAPSDARRRDLPDSFLGSQDCGAPPALPEGVEDDDAISELLAALLTCPPPNAALAPTSYAAVAASALERETDGDHCNLQPTDVDLDAQEEQEEGVPTIMVDPLSWANAERVQWISADESVELGDQVCPPAEDASLPEKSRFKRLWTQTGYPLGWASMSQGTATILATVHDQWPL